MQTKSSERKYAMLSIMLSGFIFAGIAIVNYKIAVLYVSATGKTKALFGLTELLTFGYKYYFLIPAGAALIFGVVAKLKKQHFAVAAIVMSIIAIGIIFL